QAGSSTAYCTTQTPTTTNTDGTVSFNGSNTHYAPPGHVVKRFNRFLPHLGATYMPLGDQHPFFVSYTQELAAPRTDKRHHSTCLVPAATPGTCAQFATSAPTKPETSTTYQAGYRYLGDDLQAAIIYWNSQVKNRIVSSFDQDTNTYF